MTIGWFDEAWQDYLYWQKTDKKTLRKINTLIKKIQRELFSGIGKPEPLKYNLSDYWSRRIDEKNRLVYGYEAGVLIILSCRYHYKP